MAGTILTGQHRRSVLSPRRELLERGVEDPDVIAGMVSAGIAGTEQPGEDLVGSKTSSGVASSMALRVARRIGVTWRGRDPRVRAGPAMLRRTESAWVGEGRWPAARWACEMATSRRRRVDVAAPASLQAVR